MRQYSIIKDPHGEPAWAVNGLFSFLYYRSGKAFHKKSAGIIGFLQNEILKLVIQRLVLHPLLWEAELRQLELRQLELRQPVLRQKRLPFLHAVVR